MLRMAVYTPADYAIALVMLFVVMWLASQYLFRWVELDIYLFFAMVPVMVFSISVRVLADAGVFEKNELWSVTPGIYILGTLLGVFIIMAGMLIEKRYGIPYWKNAFVLGFVPAAYFSFRLYQEMQAPLLMFQPVILALALTFAIYLLSNHSQATRLFRGKENAAIIFAHMLDGSATYIGIDKYGFSEEHILPELFINVAGTAFIMLPLKIIVILGALYLLDRWKEEDEGSDLYYKMVKFVFFIFGFGPGVRDSLLLSL